MVNASKDPNIPEIGDKVFYETDGRNGLKYPLPAVVNCTRDTHPGDYPDGRSNPLPRPPSPEVVHLTVFTPGGFGSVIGDAEKPPESDEEWVGAQTFTPGSGSYVEHNVMYDPTGGPRSWRWTVEPH